MGPSQLSTSTRQGVVDLGPKSGPTFVEPCAVGLHSAVGHFNYGHVFSLAFY